MAAAIVARMADVTYRYDDSNLVHALVTIAGVNLNDRLPRGDYSDVEVHLNEDGSGSLSLRVSTGSLSPDVMAAILNHATSTPVDQP